MGLCIRLCSWLKFTIVKGYMIRSTREKDTGRVWRIPSIGFQGSFSPVRSCVNVSLSPAEKRAVKCVYKSSLGRDLPPKVLISSYKGILCPITTTIPNSKKESRCWA